MKFWVKALYILSIAIVLSSVLRGSEWIDLKTFDFTIALDIRYASSNNFTKKNLYSKARCLLRKPVAMAISRVQAALKVEGLGLRVFDCYRPLSIQKKMWALIPDERYVANPSKGSRHNRGAAVDLTLVDSSGQELKMPSAYDDFSDRAATHCKKCSSEVKRNLKNLQTKMLREGFQIFDTEWWHFDYQGWEQFPIEDFPFQDVKG